MKNANASRHMRRCNPELQKAWRDPSFVVPSSIDLSIPPLPTISPSAVKKKSTMMSITRYKDPIPDGALIVTTLDGAAFVQKTFPHAIFYPENNGHYAKDPDGTVIAVASDALCEEIDRRNAELEAKIAAGEKLTDEYAV